MSDTSGDIVQKTKKMQDLALDGICGTCVELNNESRGLFMHISRGKSKLSSIARLRPRPQRSHFPAVTFQAPLETDACARRTFCLCLEWWKKRGFQNFPLI